METCGDKDLIERWIIVDDRSSEEDIEAMKLQFPFFETYRTEKKGQPSSINKIMELVKTEWYFHCEDDWLFLKKGNYIRKLFDIAECDERIRNVTLRNWNGNIVKHGEVEYNLHKFEPTDDHYGEKVARTDCNWYGFTFNPSLNHLLTLRLLGRLDEDYSVISRRWDRIHARKYLLLGYKRANIVGDYIEHIGQKDSYYQI